MTWIESRLAAGHVGFQACSAVGVTVRASVKLQDGSKGLWDRDEIQDACLGASGVEPLKKVPLQEYIDHCRREQYSILAHLNSGLKDVLTLSDPQVSALS